MTETELQIWASRLDEARLSGIPIPAITDTEPQLSVENAYAIAKLGIARRVAAGAGPVGHKIGLTSVAIQKQLGVDQPDYGTLLSDMQHEGETVLDVDDFVAPKVELELAFILAQDLRRSAVSADDVERATALVRPAIEIVDSRIADWRITLGDTIADNASSGAFVLGGKPHAIADVDVRAVDVTLLRGSEEIESGRSDAVMGDPRIAVAWLANALGALGTLLRAGDVILSGACTRMVPAAAGDRFTGDFGALGTVSVSFEAFA